MHQFFLALITRAIEFLLRWNIVDMRLKTYSLEGFIQITSNSSLLVDALSMVRWLLSNQILSGNFY